MTWLQSIISSFPKLYMPHVGLTDCLEILILIFTFYKIINGIKNTRAMVILKGIGILFVFYCISYILNFTAILTLFQGIITLAIFAIIVVFQPELRKFLENMGTKKVPFKNKIATLFKKNIQLEERYSEKTINALVDACYELSKTKTGALIVLEKDVPLTEYAESGIYLNAEITKELLINIFEKNTPLHDGAVIAISDKLVSATAYLPLSDNKKINKNMGTRHRAAIGISEVTDCQVLVVSEESGNVSYVKDGNIKYNLSKESLINNLKKEQYITELDEHDKNYINRIKNNYVLKIFAVIISIFAWLFIMNTANPIITRTIENVPITVINEEAITNTGKVYEIVSQKEISVLVSGKRSEIDNLTKDDIVVIGDLSKLSYVYAVPLSAYSEKYKDVVCSVKNNEIMSIKLNDKIDKEFPIETTTFGNNEKYYIGDFISEPTNIIISGPKEKINIIGKVVLNLDVTNITENGKTTLSPIIYDKNGSILTDKTITTNSPEVVLNYNIYPKKEIPVSIKIKGDTQVKNILQDVEKVTIAGTNNNLNKIKDLNIDLDLNDLPLNQSTELSKTISIKDYLPENIYIADNNTEITVTLIFDETYKKSLYFQKTDINIKNLSDKYNVIFEDTSKSIIISGEKELVDSTLINTLAPYLDLSNLGIGEYNLIPQYNTIEGIKIVESPLIKIKIVERE